MSEVPREPDPQDEQQPPEHSPVEEEFQNNRPGTPAERDWIGIIGSGTGILLVAVFFLFVIGVLVVLLVT